MRGLFLSDFFGRVQSTKRRNVKTISIIRYEELSLTEVIEKSNLIVEVKFVEKYQEEVPVVSREVDATQVVPPFIKKGNAFNVTNVLKNEHKIIIPAQIHVPDENWRRFLSQHKEQYLNTPSKSFNVPEYKTEVKSIAKATVLFLHHFQNMFELTAHGAYENEHGMEKVTMIIKGE